MLDKESKLIYESYELLTQNQLCVNILLRENYTQQQIDYILQTEGWEGIKKAARRFAPAALGAMSLANSAFGADNRATNPNNLDMRQYADNVPTAVEVSKETRLTPEQRAYQDKIVNLIKNGDTGFGMSKEALIRATSTPEEAKTYLKAMTPKQRQTSFAVYGWKADTKAFKPEKLKQWIPSGAYAICSFSSRPFIIFSDKGTEQSNKDIIETLRHEIQHATDEVQYPRHGNDYDNRGRIDNSWMGSPKKHRDQAIADVEPFSDFYRKAHVFISPNEIRGRIAGSRSYLGAITTPEQFKQKWDEAVKLYDQAEIWGHGPKAVEEWFNNDVKFDLPLNFKQLIHFYKSEMKSEEDQQKLYNYILRTALDNSVAKTKDLSKDKIA